ncbi:hypothetical protein GTY86_27875 [Streptomyces sp. SID5770]|uniref:hypothetical protein n=1 Tax=Streptomyces sp. SID5770 TaxID=2690308 RepID=UPI0013859EEF|nr:hypothetical protein [Streptomyces sp. SID5770]MZE55028.1 hypothetical protein [Streptomyces sp. SID5770]
MASMSRPHSPTQHHPDPAVHQLGRLLDRMRVAGDIRAVLNGRQARRTLQEMAPGYERQPILRLTPAPRAGAEDACPICSYWRCRCGDSLTPALAGTGSAREE